MKKFDEIFAEALERAVKTFEENDADFGALMKGEDATLADINGTFKFVISDETRDRAGEVIKVDGWDLKNYKKNPVVLFGHSYYSLPIGKATKVYIEDGKLIAEGIWASHEQAQTLRKMYDEGFVKTTSVGFIVKERDKKDDSIITRAELLEFSVVPVPANPSALSLAVEKMGEDFVSLCTTKGIFDFSVREEAEEEQQDDDDEKDDTEEEVEEETQEEDEQGTDEGGEEDKEDEKSVQDSIDAINKRLDTLCDVLGVKEESEEEDVDENDEKAIHSFVKNLQGVAGEISLILRDAKKERNKE